MRKIAIANRKGGVGKTTTAVHLAAALHSVDKSILLIDTDTQGQAARMLGMDPRAGLADLFDGRAGITPIDTGFDLLAGSADLSGVARDIARRDFRSEAVLSEVLAPFDGKYDFVILDSAPGYNPLSVNVLFYANEILCPVSMEAMAIDGMVTFLKEIEPIQTYSGLELRYVLPTFLDGRVKKSQEIFDMLKTHFGEKVLSGIHYSARLSESAGHGKLIFDYAIKDRAAIDYGKVAGEVLRNGA